MKNKVTTCGYFIKRLRDNGYTVNRIFSDYSSQDPRRWTIMVNPEIAALYILVMLIMIGAGILNLNYTTAIILKTFN